MSEIGSGRVGELGCMKPYHTCQIYVPASGQAGQDLQLYQWALRGALLSEAPCLLATWASSALAVIARARLGPDSPNGNSRRTSLQLPDAVYHSRHSRHFND